MAGFRFMLFMRMVALTVVDAILTGDDKPGFALDHGDGVSDFSAPPIAPQQFLLISSPVEKKIVWTTLENFESSDGRAFALVDSGLSEPKGLAFDHKRGLLYVADSGAKKIFRYTVLIDTSGSRPTLATTGIRLTICEGRPAEWVALDEAGNLFYTAPDTNNINKIPADVMRRIAKGEFAPSALQIISQKTLQAHQAALIQTDSDGKPLPTDAPPVKPHILSIYESKLNPHVSSPASLWAEGGDLYWVNQKDGKASGTVVKGQVDPKIKKGSKGTEAFPAQSLTNVSEGAYGMGKTEKVIFYSTNGTVENTGKVTGLLIGTDIAIDFVTSIVQPRGLVWDKDQTMYVADSFGGNVWSFPAGRMMANAPLTRAVPMKGAYGLMILSSDDPAFQQNTVTTDGELAEEETVARDVLQHNEKTNGEKSEGFLSYLGQNSDARPHPYPMSIATLLACMLSLPALFA